MKHSPKAMETEIQFSSSQQSRIACSFDAVIVASAMIAVIYEEIGKVASLPSLPSTQFP